MANSVLLSKTPGGSSSIWLSSKSLNGGLVSLSKVDRFKFVYSFPLAPHPPPPTTDQKKKELILTISPWKRASDVEQTVNVFYYIQRG